MLVEFGRGNLLQKARRHPDRVRQVVEKVGTDGLLPTLEAVRHRLGTPLPLGYCNAGIVMEAGEGVGGFQRGDLVVSNGSHADVVCVPANLCAKVPTGLVDRLGDNVFEHAAFTVLGAVALQGVRLAEPSVGETFAVIGLGLVGQLAVQILWANGCRVVGIDVATQRVMLAERSGARGVDLSKGGDPVATAMALTGGQGVDGVLLTAATESNEPVHQAARMCRKRGRIVLVGVTGLDLRRDDFYERELTFQVSCSYGPGRYDQDYENKGQDYPYGLVRWTARRNFQAVMQLMADGKLDVGPLISRKVPLEQAPDVYKELADGHADIGVILTCPDGQVKGQRTVRLRERCMHSTAPAEPVIGVIGAGNFATRTLLPALRKCRVRCKLIASRGGTGAAIAGRRFGFEDATSDATRLLEDQEITTVFILTPHDSHAALVCQALRAGKNVFVEKPLAITPAHLADVISVYEVAASGSPVPPIVHVGFNRRFAPQIRKVKELLENEPGPISLMMMVNAGKLDKSHWVQDPGIAGGRIVGEACHFIDLARFLVGARITDVASTALGKTGDGATPNDNVTITISFADGSMATVHYWSNGSKAYPKERLEVFSDGKVAVLNNFRALRGYRWPGLGMSRPRLAQDKGHETEVREFVDRVAKGGDPLIPFDELVEVTESCFKAAGDI